MSDPWGLLTDADEALRAPKKRLDQLREQLAGDPTMQLIGERLAQLHAVVDREDELFLRGQVEALITEIAWNYHLDVRLVRRLVASTSSSS